MNFIKNKTDFILFSICTLFFLAGCSIPQIVVLKDPLTPQEHLHLGVSYESRNQLELAESQYRKAAAHDLPEAYLYLGNIAYRQKKFKDAETFYHKAIKKMPEDPRAYNNLAWLYYEQGDADLTEAENLARKALDLAPPKDRSAYLDTLEKIMSAQKPKDHQ